ncbi:hypothetical protein ABVF61_06975 [Roseibium sp. HPY-6]
MIGFVNVVNATLRETTRTAGSNAKKHVVPADAKARRPKTKA